MTLSCQKLTHIPSTESDVDSDIDPTRRALLGLLAGVTLLGACPVLAGTKHGAKREPPLETKIDRYISRMRRQGKIATDERTAWSVYDFTTRRKLVSINETVPFQSASMIKPFVALAFFYRVKEGRLRYLPQHHRKLEAMLRWSNNQATNYFIDLICGRSRNPRTIERLLKSHEPSIFKQTRIVEHIPSGGRSYRNLASAQDYSRFLYALWYDRFPYSREIKFLMGLPNRDRLSTGVANIPSDTKVYDKTGSTARLCGNMGILVARDRRGRGYPYTMIGIIQKSHRASDYRRWSKSRGDIIREVSRMSYDHISHLNGFV